jgi:hypothetical protein
MLDATDPNTHIYGVEMAISQDWAAKLLTLGLPSNLPVTFDGTSGAVTKTSAKSLRKRRAPIRSRSTSR